MHKGKIEVVEYKGYKSYSEDEMRKRALDYFLQMNRRRTVRDFSSKEVPREIIEQCIKTANTAPSGANLQPWHFVAVSNSEIKRKIRIAAEKEEYEFYNGRASEEWLKDLEHLGTNDKKPFLESAPWLIAVFEKRYGIDEQNNKRKHYYVSESVGLATGMLISAVHNAGLASLTHTPSPMKFLNEVLERPINEKPFLLLVVGFPSNNVTVPDINRKVLTEIATFV